MKKHAMNSRFSLVIFIRIILDVYYLNSIISMIIYHYVLQTFPDTTKSKFDCHRQPVLDRRAT